MPGTRTAVFGRVYIDYEIRGTTRVSWGLRSRFTDPGPYTFQLQVSRNGGDSWEDVGSPVVDIFYALDTTPRLYGQNVELAYRVQLTTAAGTYNSPPAQPLGNMSKRMWLIAREIIRRAKQSVKQRGLRSLDGWLLRRKIEGQVCPDCTDEFTGGITNSDCTTCHGTGFVDGYWNAVENSVIDISPLGSAQQKTQSRGTYDPAKVVQARFIGLPLVQTRDIWVADGTGLRYYIDTIRHAAEMNQVPLVVDATLRVAEATDVAYTIPLS